MKENNKEKLRKSIYKLCDDSYKFIHKITKNNIELYEIQYKDLISELEILIENEPMQIFKKKYSDWENKVKAKEQEINEILRRINEELKSLKDKE